jgi:hypothetical protein
MLLVLIVDAYYLNIDHVCQFLFYTFNIPRSVQLIGKKSIKTTQYISGEIWTFLKAFNFYIFSNQVFFLGMGYICLDYK